MISLVSSEFEKEYGENMVTYLTSFLDTEELQRVKEIIGQLP